MDINEISSVQLDALKEICNIGAGNAATALSQILDRKVDMHVPEAAFVGFDDIAGILGSEEMVVLGIMILLEGDVEGSMVFLITKESASVMISSLLKKDFDCDIEFDEMDMSAIKEIGNIIVSSYITSLSMMTGFNIRVSEPFATVDMVASILSVPVAEVGKCGDNVLFMKSFISCEDFELGGNFIMLPTIESFEKIMTSLGM